MIILIDNYDSFTYNLYQYLGDLGFEATVYRNDQISIEDVLNCKPKGVLISPGPSNPDHAGICLPLISSCLATGIPLLGVCLGHQAIGQALGGRIVRTTPKHGKRDTITHNGKGLFTDMNSPMEVARYHSLIIERETCPAELEITAQTSNGIIMAVQHKSKPVYGVQFHPESIATQNGHTLLKNFCDTL